MKNLFHVSEQPDIKLFEPLPSPSYYENINDRVVFAIGEKLLHNYLLPRDCPRVAYYLNPCTADADQEKFMGESTASYIINVPVNWYEQIAAARLFCYEFLPDSFTLLDECAGYYISYQTIAPLAVKPVNDCMAELRKRNVELRFSSNLITLAQEVSRSSLNFSLKDAQ